MARELQIPLVLWVSAAVVVHLLGGGGATATVLVAEKHARDRADIRSMLHGVRSEVRRTTVTEMEVDIDPAALEQIAALEQAAQGGAEPDAPPMAEPAPPPAASVAAVEPPQPAPSSQPEEPKPEEKAAAATPLPVIAPDRRIAIRQHAAPDQQDNPDAPRIADEANRVEEETMAKHRSLDRDDPDPTAGSSPKGPSEEEGNADETKVAQSEDRPGDEKLAPGAEPAAAAAAAEPGGGGQPAPGRETKAMAPAEAPSLGGAGAGANEVVTGAQGSWSIDPQSPGGDGSGSRTGASRKGREGPSVDVKSSLGLGAAGRPGAPPGLDWGMFQRTVGTTQLDAERVAAGRAIRSKHRGRFDTNKFERWRPAIENYDPSVKSGNQTALNAARVPFASYLHSIHNRLHPIFGDEFLASLQGLPEGHMLSSMDLVAHVELVLSRDDGKIVRIGITKNSGSTVFDAVALESLDRASPFGKAPDAIASPDGLVYLHWEFHRDPFDACSTRNARPFMLREAPKPRTTPLPPPRPRPRPGETQAEGNDTGPLLPLRKR
jgi:hypothetical protein